MPGVPSSAATTSRGVFSHPGCLSAVPCVQCCKDKQDQDGTTDPSCEDVNTTPCSYWPAQSLDACCTDKADAGISDDSCPESPLSPIFISPESPYSPEEPNEISPDVSSPDVLSPEDSPEPSPAATSPDDSPDDDEMSPFAGSPEEAEDAEGNESEGEDGEGDDGMPTPAPAPA